MTMYTSLELSNKLSEKKCCLSYDKCWLYRPETLDFVLINTSELPEIQTSYPAYDIVYDICIRYAKEFFGEEELCIDCGKKEEHCNCYHGGEYPIGTKSYEWHTEKIFKLLQQGKDEKEIEDYFWSVCKFNKKNKEQNVQKTNK